MNCQTQLGLHKNFLGSGGFYVAIGFLLMWLNFTRLSFDVIVMGLFLLLGGVATTFARDKDGNERLVEDIVREERQEKHS